LRLGTTMGAAFGVWGLAAATFAAGDPNPYDAVEVNPEEGRPAPPEPRAPQEEFIERRKVPFREGMLRIPGGEFFMGYDGPLPHESNEVPAHLVHVEPFWIDQHEVAVDDVRTCVDRGQCKLRLGRGPLCTLERGDPKLPVNCVPWQSADAYCRAVRKRLPTEAEWELAAGGGLHLRFPWGTVAPSCRLAVTLLSNRAGTSCDPHGPSQVASHSRGASYFGVEDMSGNVEEWVADWYADRYEVRAAQEQMVASPVGPAFGVAHVLRGGGWMSRPREARVTARNWGSPNEAGPNVGFRCARDDLPESAGAPGDSK
jgi:formylglycine-generating enzyme required for sulfatase activity